MSTPITIPVNFDFGPGFSSAPRAAAELQRIFNQGNNFNRISQPLGQMSRSADEFANSLKAANARVLAFGASAAVIITVQRALEGLVTSTINVEKRLTDINVVLNESRAGLQKFGAELFVTARQTGQSFDAVSDAALELSRQGLSVQETLKRTRDALVLTRLSGLDAKDSVEALTAGINSFNRTLVTSTELVNKFAAVDARFAVSSADLAEALKRVGSTAQDAGVGLEELLGLVTAVQQTTARGGAVIGNAFKNIFSRLSRSTTIEDLRALGVQIDASQTGVEKLQALADAYKRVGVEQANQIKEAAGGVYQINVVAAALDQLSRKYGTYQQALAAANSATDEATLRNEALNQTLSALINRTQVNFTKLFSDIGSLSIDSPLRNILGGLNSALESVSDGETTGGKLAESFLKGIGKFIEGPGAIYLGTIALVLSKRLAGFAGDAFKQLNNIKFGDAERRLNVEKSIQSIIGNNPRIQDQILNGSLRIEDVQSRILADLRQEVVLRERIAALSQRIAPAVLRSGIAINPTTNFPERRTRASGLIPTPEESMAETMGAYAAGYTPGNVKAANIKGLGRIIYNDAEKVVDIGLSQPAIIPPRNSQVSGVYRNKFQQRFGVDPYALANGYVPNFKNENNFRMRKGAFGDYEFENRFGGGVVDIFDDEAEIGAIDTKEQGKGTYKFLLSDLMSNLKQKGIKKVKGFLIPQNNKPKTDALTDQIKAAYPQLIRGRYGKSSILTIDGRAVRLAGGEAFDASLEKQANTILSSIRNGGDVDFETFLNKGLVPNFNSLTSAITREAAAVNPSQIRIGQDTRLVNSKNPAGIGVYNTKDEPGGLGQGIARAYAEGLNPKTYNVPNYAPKKVISGGVDPLIVSGTSGGQKFEIIVKIPTLDRAAASFDNMVREQKIDRTVKERNDARSIARQAKIQEEERFLFNTPFRRERRLNSERNLLAQQSAFAASAPNITVPNPFGAISVPSLPGAPLATQPQTLQDRININNAVRQAQENINRRNEDAAARDRRRLDQASNSINPPQIGRIYVPNVNESRNINGGAQYVNNQGRVDDPFIRNRSTAPPIIGANGRIFIPGVSDLQQRQEQALRDIENQNAIRAAREAELRNRGSSIFRGRSRRAQASLLSEGLVTRDDLIGIENLRQNKLQNFGFGLSLAAPIVSQFAADALQNGRQSGRIAGAAASGLGNAFSFGATAFTATGGNPAATAIGVVIGALTGLVGVAKEAGNTIPELTDRIEKLQGQTNETARAASEYFSVSEKIKQITLGQTSATKGQLNELQNTQTAAFLSLPQEIREIVKTSVAKDDVEGAYRAIDRVQVLITQQANLLQEIVKIQTANKDLRFNQNSNQNGSGFLGVSGRNLSEFTKFSIDNPLLGGVALGGLRGGATDARKALRILSNNSFGDLALGAVDSLGLDITNQGLPQNKTQLADEVFNGSVLTTSEQKDLLRERRQFNRSNRSVVNQLIGFTNESGSNFAEVASQDPAFQEALATKNTSQIIKQAKEVAKKNNFNFLAISEFLTDYTESVSNVQFDLLANAAQALSKGKFDEAKQLGEKFRADINKRENVKFNIDRNFGNYFDNLSEIGRRQSVVFDNSTANLSLQNRIGAISAEGFFDRQNLLGGERTAIINRGALSQRVAGNQFQENLLGANQSFASNSFRDIAQTLKEATDKISINAQGSNGTAEQRQNRLNAVRSLFTEQLGLNPETLNADKLTPQTVTALIAKVRDSERTLLTARDNNQTISANGISLTNQDINSILNEYSQLTKKLNDNLKDLSDTSNKANQAYKGNITEILKETFERIRTKNAQEALTLSLEKAAFTFGNETSLRNARFETGQTARNANNTISNLGLVGFDRIRAEGAFSLDQIQTRARFGLGQSERSLIGQALGQKDALSNDLSASGISDLAGVNQRISALSLNTDPASVDILNKYKSLQQQIIAQQNEINSLLPEQLAQERELIKLKEQELRFSTAFSDEQARLNLSGVEGRIRTGQGIGFGDFRQTVGDQFNYTAKDFQRDAITGTAEVAGTIKSSFASATADVIKNGKNIKEALTGVLTGVLDKIIDKTTEISTGFLFSGLKAVAGFSAGGPVLDGSGVRDDVPALLTKGEFVIKKDAVQKIGLQNLQKLNSGVNINLRNEFSYDDERRPTRGQQNIDPNLSVIGLTDTEISRTNQLKFSREQELASYLNDYRNYEQSKRDALKAYADQKRNRLYGSYISAGIGVAGAGFSSYFQGVGARGNTNAGVRGGVDYNYRSNPYSSGIANVASGGVMFGGTSSSDVVPARLTRGEFVMNKSTVDRVGVNVFKSINNGYEAGGLVRSPVVTPQKSTLAMAQPASQNNTNISNQSTNNISINVNITSDGKVSSSVNEDNKKKSEQGKALGELISSKVRETMVKESAQGGLLYNMVRANK